jgi:hypothetical protein
MRIPEFAAEASLAETSNCYCSRMTHTTRSNVEVLPQKTRIFGPYVNHPGEVCVGVEDEERGQSYEVCGRTTFPEY